MFVENPRVTIEDIEGYIGIGSAAVQSIIHEHLGLRTLTSRWVPHFLTDIQKKARVDWCNFMLRKFNGGGSKRVWNIITADESWIYNYDPESKRQSMVWCAQDDAPPPHQDSAV